MLKVWNHLPLSFGRLCEMVDHDFPVLDLEGEADVQCADTFEQVNYWREQIPDGTKQQEDPVTLETRWENVLLRTLRARLGPEGSWLTVKATAQFQSEAVGHFKIKEPFLINDWTASSLKDQRLQIRYCDYWFRDKPPWTASVNRAHTDVVTEFTVHKK